MSGPTQPKVEDEQWSDERIRGFLSLKPLDGNHPDFHVLQQAYQHMTPDFFSRFIIMFVSERRDINALSLEGETLLARISKHKRAESYSNSLRSSGAV